MPVCGLHRATGAADADGVHGRVGVELDGHVHGGDHDPQPGLDGVAERGLGFGVAAVAGHGPLVVEHHVPGGGVHERAPVRVRDQPAFFQGSAGEGGALHGDGASVEPAHHPRRQQSVRTDAVEAWPGGLTGAPFGLLDPVHGPQVSGHTGAAERNHRELVGVVGLREPLDVPGEHRSGPGRDLHGGTQPPQAATVGAVGPRRVAARHVREGHHQLGGPDVPGRRVAAPGDLESFHVAGEVLDVADTRRVPRSRVPPSPVPHVGGGRHGNQDTHLVGGAGRVGGHGRPLDEWRGAGGKGGHRAT